MAIKYLSNINLSNNQLTNFKVDNVTSDPSGLSGEGQLIYRTDTNELKFHTGSNSWSTLGTGSGSGTVTSITLGADSGSGTAITSAGTFTFTGGTNITTSVSGTTVTINADLSGTVTSVAAAAGTGDKAGIAIVSGSPITSSGTITIGVDIEGQTELSATAAAGDYVLIWDADADANKKISVTNLVAAAPQGDITGLTAGTAIGITNPTGPVPTINNTGVTSIVAGTNVTISGATGAVTINADTQGDITAVAASTDNDQKGIEVTSGTGPIPEVGVNIIGQTNLGGTAATDDELLIYDLSTTTNKSITVANLLAAAPQGDITAVTASTANAKKGITVATGTGPIPDVGLDIINQTNLAATAAVDDELIIYDLSTTTNKSITVANLIAAAPQGDLTGLTAGTGITITSATGPVPTITNAGVTSAVASTGISVSGATGAVTFTNTGVTSIVAGTGISINSATGAVTVTNTVTNTNYTYALSVGAVSSNESTLTLTGGGGGSSTTAKFSGTTNEIEITTPSTGDGGDITIGLPSDVTIGNDLTVTGELAVSGTGQSSFGGQVTVPTTPSAGTDAASKSYVDTSVTGALVYQGGYNATTNSPDLDSGSNIAITKGWTYTVTVAGDFFTEAVEVGDLLIAEEDMSASGGSTLAKWTTVQNNIGIATAAATDGAAVKGIAGFDSDNFSVTTNGWVTLDTSGVTAAAYGSASETLTATVDAQGLVTAMADTSISITASQVSDFCAAVETCADSNLTYAANIGDNSAVTYRVTHSLDTRDVIVQIYDTTTYDTINADVVRTDPDYVDITTVTALGTAAARVLVSKCA